MQEFAGATNDYDRAIELEPENERLYFLWGVFRMNCQLTELALADFERVLAITGGDDSASEHRASLLLRLNRYQEAIEDFAQLIAKGKEKGTQGKEKGTQRTQLFCKIAASPFLPRPLVPFFAMPALLPALLPAVPFLPRSTRP